MLEFITSYIANLQTISDMPKQFKEIILGHGELKDICKELNKGSNTVHYAIKGYFNESSKNYNSNLEIRRYILEKFPNRYKCIKQ